MKSVIASSKARGLGARTLNKSLRAVKSFSRWLVRDGRAPHDALAFVPMLNERLDRRRERRELTSEELDRLFRAADRGATVFGLSGIDRGMLYRLAVGTGFRASELASLTPESFTLGGSPPLVVVGAAYSKHRRQDEQPIPSGLASLLEPWIASKTKGRPVFDVLRLADKTGDMMRHDLEVAEIPHTLDGKVADFHALRHTYVSRVVRSGATVKEAQLLARHADPSLTIGRYAHAQRHDLARAVDRIEATPAAPESIALRLTGTDGNAPSDGFDRQQKRQQSAHDSGQNSASSCDSNEPGSSFGASRFPSAERFESPNVSAVTQTRPPAVESN